MIVYRVQNAKGRGVYRDMWVPELLGLEVSRAPAHQPGPMRDGIPCVWRGEVFGFDSLDACFAWFGRETLEKASALGYFVYCFSVPEKDVTFGGHQLVFPRCSARRIRYVPLEERKAA